MTKLDQDTIQRACILFDGAILDAPRFVYEHDDQPELEYLYLGTPHDEALEISPCLVKPSPMSRLWQEQAQWREHAVVLISDENLNVLANHLRSLLSVQLPDGGYSYLRFYSPKQFQRLMGALSDLESNRFSGPVKKWMSFQADGLWHRTKADGSGQYREASDEGWFVLTEHHLEALSSGARDEFVGKLGRFLGVEDRVKLTDLIREANSLGFRTEKDVSRYAELVVVHGERVRHPELQAILSNSELSARMRLIEVDKRLAYGVAS
ncbi:DUF4123 domain-containing protein [Marinobacter sp. ATCH36]|uniref:DUF4123 domain-containing protein n=1 Tax=Marinobacter sp. ATCH36 TaxID=2945106 RepID=UPI002021F1BE|nr:DUF4123 domain-containing protein [Marinobacter sp. ATCH36]MCL7945940.1 DUF4123 domain-containing protein [Marinobacter sp. ATCH36]